MNHWCSTINTGRFNKFAKVTVSSQKLKYKYKIIKGITMTKYYFLVQCWCHDVVFAGGDAGGL